MKKENSELIKTESENVKGFTPVQKTDTEALYQKALAQTKNTIKIMLDSAEKEAIKHRLAAGLDEKGHPIKKEPVYDETGMVIKSKRGRKPKIKSVTSSDVSATSIIEKTKKNKEDTNSTKEKSIKKKEKSGRRGRISALPILYFEENLSANEKLSRFDKTVNDLIGKYDGKTLIFKDEKINLLREITKSTKKNPMGVLHVVGTKDGSTKKLNSYEWNGKFYPSRIFNYVKNVITK